MNEQARPQEPLFLIPDDAITAHFLAEHPTISPVEISQDGKPRISFSAPVAKVYTQWLLEQGAISTPVFQRRWRIWRHDCKPYSRRPRPGSAHGW